MKKLLLYFQHLVLLYHLGLLLRLLKHPIWLDQTYFAIRGLRNYGYHKLADEYTLQVFDRLNGLKEGAPIHENYGTHTGERLKAPHFSWSSSHLLMMYDDYGK